MDICLNLPVIRSYASIAGSWCDTEYNAIASCCKSQTSNSNFFLSYSQLGITHYTTATTGKLNITLSLSLSLSLYIYIYIYPRMLWKGDGDGGIITQLPSCIFNNIYVIKINIKSAAVSVRTKYAYFSISVWLRCPLSCVGLWTVYLTGWRDSINKKKVLIYLKLQRQNIIRKPALKQ